MSKKKQIVKPESGIRLKALLEQTGMSQAELSKEINLSQQTISKIINGKTTLTGENATRIAELFPLKDNLFLWLTCQSDFQTKTEKIMDGLTNAIFKSDRRLTGFSCLAKCAGYDVTIITPKGRKIDGMETSHGGLEEWGSRYIISNDAGECVADMDGDEMNELEERTFNAFKTALDDFLSFRKMLFRENDVDLRYIKDLDQSEFRFNVETGKAEILAKDFDDAQKAFESLIDRGLIRR